MNIDMPIKKPQYSPLKGLVALVFTLAALGVFLPDAIASIAEDESEMSDSSFMDSSSRRKPRTFRNTAEAKRPGGMGKDVFKPYTDRLEAYFRPLSANVVSATGGELVSDIVNSAGVVEGMRFNIMRPSGVFVHPVTGQKVTGSETLAGRAELTSGAGLIVISGQSAMGDLIRIPSSQVKVLFYQDEALDWDVAEEYYYWLGDSGRFVIIDAASDWGDEEKLLLAARDYGAEIIVMLSPLGVTAEDGAMRIRQRVIWTSDGAELVSEEITVDEMTLKALKIAGEMFSPPDKSKPLFEFRLPTRASLMDVADMDCDGRSEVVVSTGSGLSFFGIDLSIVPPFGMDEPLEVPGVVGRKHVWLEAADLDGDGCQELLATTVKNDREVRSFVYDYTPDGLKVLWEDDVFIRVVGGALYAQNPASSGGYEGAVYPLDLGISNAPGETSPLTLPEGANIYDFMLMPSGDGMLVWQPDGRLALYNAPSLDKLWVSEDSYGGALMRFRLGVSQELPEGVRPVEWFVSDRLVVRGGAVYAPYRVLLSERAPELGFSGSGIIRLAPAAEGAPEAIKEEVFVRDIESAVGGFAFQGDRFYVIRDSLSTNWGSFLKGKGLFISKLFVYLVEGR